MLNKKLLYLILPIITLILEILPYGAVCNFEELPLPTDKTNIDKVYRYIQTLRNTNKVMFLFGSIKDKFNKLINNFKN